ncbi:DUF1273 domain-containing protein [Lacticaseibacillus baoqingensis]|uniref:DUF1273 domain-containing protein n=1 Tax=Lacticaseibacillus baoqingensis TaxID=2486013 RepID=A0ABW4E9W4_9LACO|nr:DUF1273 domain-containing protein [Lacticaseibacillus baoqingensis]
MRERLWLSGYRAWELNVYGDHDPKLKVLKYSLKIQLQQALDEGMQWLITGGELGIEQWGIEVALGLKADYPELQIAMMLPYAEFGHQWQAENQERLAKRRSQVDFARETSTQPYTQPAQLSGYNRFMAQHTDGALFYYDQDFPGKPQYAYKAAQAEANRRDYAVRTVTMPDLEDVGRELAEAENSDFQN